MKRIPLVPFAVLVLAAGCGDDDLTGPSPVTTADPALMAAEDVTPPELVEFSFSPTSIDIRGGDQGVTVTLRITDDLSGLNSSGGMTFRSPSGGQSASGGFGPFSRISGDAQDGVYEAFPVFRQFSEAGTWRVTHVFMRDLVGNSISLNEADLIALGFPTELEVVSVQDITAPELVEFSFSPTSIDIRGGDQGVTVTLRITDDLSGLNSSGGMTFRSPSGGQSASGGFGPFSRISGDAQDGVYEAFPVFRQFSEAGTWRVTHVFMRDLVGNSISLNEADLIALGFPTQLNVTVNQPPVADAQGPYTGVEGSSVAFDGTGSFDPDGDPLAYDWSFGDGGNATSSPTPSHTYADNGTFDVSLEVGDPDGLTDTDATTATIANVAPAVNPGPNAMIFSGLTFTLSASFSDPGVDDAPWQFTIDWGDNTSESGSTNDQSAAITGTHTYFAPRDYPVTVTVTDKDGGTGSGSLTLTVKAIPVAIDIKPGSFPNSVNLEGKGLIPVGVITGSQPANLTTVDATTIIDATVEFAGAAIAHRRGHTEDVNGDAWGDRVYHFRTQDTNLNGGDTSATLTAQLADGRFIEGTDSVRIVP